MSTVASTASFGSSGGVSNNSSRVKSTRRYRTIHRNSSVDEMLFGSDRTNSAPSERLVANKDISTNRSNSAPKNQKGGDIIQVITKDMIRTLRVPNEDPSGESLILNSKQFTRIRNASKVLSKREREALQEQMKLEKKMLQEGAEDRKNFMQTMEMTRRRNEKLSDLEQEAKEQSQYLLQKAQEQVEEQEDEIKKLNEIILNAKCHAIRDAQLIEKAEIKKEILEEDKRLDEMMESDRVRVLAEYEERENEKRLERLRGAQVLQQQIVDNEQANLLEKERKEQETKIMLQYLEKLQLEDMDALKKKRETQKKILKDVAKSNEEILSMKERLRKREQMEEQKVLEYTRQKQARDEAHEREKEKQRLEKEQEIARLRAQQERVKDKQAERDLLRAKRNHEQAEREWRRKEKEEAIRKAQTERQLRNARQEQIDNKEHFLAVQAAKDRAEFERVLNAQNEQVKKDEEAQEEFHSKRVLYSNDVRTQIQEKEKERVHARQSFFQEGIKLDYEAKERQQKIDEIKRRKLNELKEAGVPDKYVTEVARRIDGPPHSLANIS